MTKKLFFILPVVFLVSLLFPLHTLAQSNDPIVLGISPSQIPANQKNIVSISGENLIDPVSIYLNNANGEVVLTYKVISSNEISVNIPPLDIGNYSLCVRFTTLRDCREVKVTGEQVSVVSISPSTIYNPIENQISIIINHGPDITNLYLNDLETQIVSIKRDVGNGTDDITVVVPPNIPTGTVKFVAKLSDGQEVTLDSLLVIKGPINASIKSIEPNKILRYTSSETLLTITGENFEGIKSIIWSPIIYCLDVSKCDNVTVSNSEIKIQVTNSGAFDNLAISDGRLVFYDGSEVSLTNQLTIKDRVFPWNSLSLVSYIAFLILFSISWSIIYFLSFSYSHDKFKANQTAPTISHSIWIVFTGAGWGVLLSVGAWVIWGLFSSFSGSTSFVISTLLFTLNCVYPVIYWNLSVKFGNFIPIITRAITTILVMIAAVASPIIFTYTLETQLSLLVSLLLFLIVSVLGSLSLEYTRRQLESLRVKGPSEEEIYNRVAEDIFRKGQLSAEKDYKELPKDRVVSAFSSFFSRNKNLKIEFSDYSGTISFTKHENIKSISLGFQELRKRIETKDAWTASDVNHLEQIIRKEFGFKVGKNLQKVKKSGRFFVYALKPTGVESVLPDPFPLIIYCSDQAISITELDELQEILNQLDTKARFAILVALNESSVIKEKIQERFKGIGRENIVVLGEKECQVIIGNSDPLRLAFMKILQEQVDLLVFKPYNVEGPTPVDMFYGRRQEINSVVERIADGSVAVLGARRIGKTSMLQATKRILEERGKLVLYLDCYDVFDYATLLQRMELDWDIHNIPKGILKTLNDFPNWLLKVQNLYPKRQIILLLDEIDKLINYDQKQKQQEKLFRMFRSLAQEGRCQFIFSGERIILEQLSNSKSPFFNFTSPVKLGLLDGETTDKIVVDPMRLIGTTIKNDKEITKNIFEYTNGHPSLVQFICLESLEEMNKVKTRIFDFETVQKITHGQAFRDRYLETYWSQSNPLEKAVSLIVAEEQPIKINHIHSKLQELGFKASIEDVRKGIRYLSLCQVLYSEKDEYKIALTKFKEMSSIFPYTIWMDDLNQEWKLTTKSKQ